MKHTATLGLALMTVLTLSGTSATAVRANSAPHWTVVENGVSKTLSSSESRTLTGETTGTLSLKFALNFTIGGCTIHGNITGSGVGAPGTWTGKLHCTELGLEGAPMCNAHGKEAAKGTFETPTLLGTLVWLAKEGDEKVGILLKPDEGVKFAEFELSECGILSGAKYQFQGELLCEVARSTVDVIFNTFDCPSVPKLKYFSNGTGRLETSVTQLNVFGSKATFTAHFPNLHLSKETLWGIETG